MLDDFAFSSTSTATTSQTSSHCPSFPVLSHNDALIINQIIASTPSGSSIFNALLDSYHQVLGQHNLDTRLDDKYYSLLLKLSLVEGVDWQERWSRICRSQSLAFDPRPQPQLDHRLPLAPVELSSIGSSFDEGSRTILARPNANKHPFSPPLTPNPPPPATTTRLLARPASGLPFQSTPNRIVRFTPARLRIHSASTDQTDQTDPERDVLGGRFVDPLDALSDRTRRHSLLKTCLAAWTLRLRRAADARAEVERARDVLLRSQFWRRWRSKVGKRRREITMVEGVAKTRLKFATLARWREAAVESQRRRWKDYLQQLASEFKDRRSHQLSVEILINWSLKARLSAKTKEQEGSLKQLTILRWSSHLSKIRHADALASQYFEQIKSKNELRRLSAHWRWKTGLSVKEHRLLAASETRYQTAVLQRWFHAAMRNRVAYEHWVDSARRTWLRIWRKQRHRLKRMERKATRIIAIRNENLLSRTMNRWMIHERGQLLGRVLLTRLLRGAVLTWLAKLDRIRFYLDAGRQVFQKKLARKDQIRVLKRWREATEKKAKLLPTQASGRYRTNLVARHLHRWVAARQAARERTARAALCWRAALLQRALEGWLKRYRRSRILRLVRRKKEAVLSQFLLDWVHITRQKRMDQQLLVAYEARVTPGRLSATLGVWLRRVVSLKDRQRQVDQVYTRGLLSVHFETWVGRVREIGHLDELARGFAEIQRIERRDRMLKFWRKKAADSRRRMDKLRDWDRAKDERLARWAWVEWTDEMAERRLAAQEHVARDAYQQRLRKEAAERWMGRTRTIPMLRAQRRRQTVASWTHWTALLPVRRLRRAAVQRDRAQVLGEAFRVWWGKCTALQASRIVSRFSRPSVFAGGRRRSRSVAHPAEPVRRQLLHGPPSAELCLSPGSGSKPASQSGGPRMVMRAAVSMYGSSTSEEESVQDLVLRPRGASSAGQEDEQEAATGAGEEAEPEEEERTEEVEMEEGEQPGSGSEPVEEDERTIVGQSTELTEEPSTTEPEGVTENEIELAIGRGRLFGGLRRRVGHETGLANGAMSPTPPVAVGVVNGSVTSSTSTRSSGSGLGRQAVERPRSFTSGGNQLLVGLRNLDRRRNTGLGGLGSGVGSNAVGRGGETGRGRNVDQGFRNF